ncbi:adenylate/guanylate cyclase domain-containing protein [Hartmannibacter diazotrophicus]|uniref:adenylate/guanylate cyclase domain-containing protein n=1 Tax=Hartmannibacter diazotrophicus TaxID=1482074 RepID=UPI0013900708|nr:adenylate/guanylate cyclase domain-containing protein [Hartmannibacter diazotrophicus]
MSVAQRLSGPSELILGFQSLVVEEVRRIGPAAALEDLEKVLVAAQTLGQIVQRLLMNDLGDEFSALDDATLRHDLRTPVNAIIGYSELVLEDFAGDLDGSVEADIRLVLTECGRLLDQIESLLIFSRRQGETVAAEAAEVSMAEALARSLSGQDERKPVDGGRILVIDDTPANCELLMRQLARHGHEVTTATSGREAMEILRRETFHLALIDILMPDLNGIELLACLKSDPDWRDMAVIMVSGLKETEAVLRCISAGAEDYLQKPIDPVLLHARVDACIERMRLRERERQFLARIEYEKERADSLLQAMLPEPVIRRLGNGEVIIADRFEDVTVIFADIVDFTPLVARTDPSMLLKQLGVIFSEFDDLADKHGIEKIKTIGDAYMAVAGVPDPVHDHVWRALAFARDIIHATSCGALAHTGLAIRVGLHRGPVIAGLIGRKRFVYDVWGETVNLASRLESTSPVGRIHLSAAALEGLEGLDLAPQAAENFLKGIGRMTTYVVD